MYVHEEKVMQVAFQFHSIAPYIPIIFSLYLKIILFDDYSNMIEEKHRSLRGRNE